MTDVLTSNNALTSASSIDPAIRIAALEQELHETRQLVHTVMRDSSDQGFIVQFLRKSFTLNSYDELAEALIEQLESKQLDASVLISTDQGRLLTKLGCENPQAIDLLHSHRSGGRIYEYENLCLINFDHESLVISNMPEDEELRGHLRDVLAALMEAIEAKVSSLNTENHAARLRKSKDEFYQIMSHELKTPLNSVIGFSTSLNKRLKNKVSEREHAALQKIQHSGSQLLGLVDGILDLSKFESGDIVVCASLTDINRLLEQLLLNFQAAATTKGLALTLQIEGEIELYCDAEKLQTVLSYMLDNAIQYTCEGDVSLAFRKQDDDRLGPCYAFSITDTGIGVAEHDQQRIFHQFTQLDTGVARESKGTGIGLTLASKLMALLGGRIDLTSEQGQGSCFTLLLPE